MICNYLPGFMRGIKEIAHITQAENDEFEVVNQAVKSSLDDSFAAFADDSAGGLTRWEKMLGIVSRRGRTDEFRRQVISERLSDKLPYTFNTLNSMLTDLCGDNGRPRHTLTVDCSRYKVTVLLEMDAERFVADVQRIMRARIPANMLLDVTVDFYKHWDLRMRTHQWLRAYTHRQIRRGMFN